MNLLVAVDVINKAKQLGSLKVFLANIINLHKLFVIIQRRRITTIIKAKNLNLKIKHLKVVFSKKINKFSNN